MRAGDDRPIFVPLFMALPGGLDRYFDAVARARADGVLDEALSRMLSEDHGIEWLE